MSEKIKRIASVWFVVLVISALIFLFVGSIASSLTSGKCVALGWDDGQWSVTSGHECVIYVRVPLEEAENVVGHPSVKLEIR